MRYIFAFLVGLAEFRSDLTTWYRDTGLLEAHDRGRALGRRLWRLP